MAVLHSTIETDAQAERAVLDWRCRLEAGEPWVSIEAEVMWRTGASRDGLVRVVRAADRLRVRFWRSAGWTLA